MRRQPSMAQTPSSGLGTSRYPCPPVIVFVLPRVRWLQLSRTIHIMGRWSDPANSALTLAVLLYRKAFTHFDLGYASALGFLMAIIILAISVIQFKLVGFFDD